MVASAEFLYPANVGVAMISSRFGSEIANKCILSKINIK
jgi:hypothetical protein